MKMTADNIADATARAALTGKRVEVHDDDHRGHRRSMVAVSMNVQITPDVCGVADVVPLVSCHGYDIIIRDSVLWTATLK